MIIASTITFTIAMTALGLVGYFVFRNNKLYEYRVGLIDRDFDAYKNLPSYDKMLYSLKSLTDKNWAPNAKKE